MTDLAVRVRADDTGLDAQLKGISKKFEKVAEGFASIGIPVAIAAGIAKALDGLAKIGEQAIKVIAPLQDTADQLDVTAERLQELRLVAGNAGVGVEELDKSLGTLTRNIGNAALGG